jgi:1-acyl-sn-glycerol-3-phosphate acyltransferase
MPNKKRFTDGLLRVMGFILRCFIRLLARVEVKNPEYLRQKKAFIFASNHISYWDPPTLLAFTLLYLKEPLLPAATKGLFVFPLNVILRLIKAVPINREVKHSNIKSLRSMILALSQQNRSVLFFPQGGIDRTSQTHMLFKGVGLIAFKSQSPVIPCMISGTNHIFSRKRSLLKRPNIRICIGKPISFDDIDNASLVHRDHYQYLAEKIMEEVYRLKNDE